MMSRAVPMVSQRRTLVLAACVAATTLLACTGRESSAGAGSASASPPANVRASSGAKPGTAHGAPIPPAAPRASSGTNTDAPVKAAAEQAPQQVGGAAADGRVIQVGGVDLTSVGYDRGNPNAPVVLVELSDFGCPYCGAFERETFPAIEREYIRTGKVFFKSVQFVMGSFPNATEAARAAECAADQRQFWAMSDRLYRTQPDWKGTSSPAPVLVRDAAAIGLDTTRFAACYDTGAMHPRTRLATAAANLLGVRATPSFLVNGRPIEGALPLDAFRSVLDAAAGKRSQPVGTP